MCRKSRAYTRAHGGVTANYSWSTGATGTDHITYTPTANATISLNGVETVCGHTAPFPRHKQ
ncbi:MAG: hypothetical protein WDO15_29335 [Bacteroidota bacterium]